MEVVALWNSRKHEVWSLLAFLVVLSVKLVVVLLLLEARLYSDLDHCHLGPSVWRSPSGVLEVAQSSV